MKRWIPFFALLLLGAAPSRTQTYTAGTVISPTAVTENEDNIYVYLQGGVDTYKAGTVNSNAILDGTITSADIGTGAVTSATILDGTIATGDIANNAVNGTKIAIGSDAQGDILYYDGTDYVRLGAGTSGQMLQTQGASANPKWASAVQSGRTHITAGDYSITSTTFADVDTTNVAVTLTTGANRVLIGATVNANNSAAGNTNRFDVTIDGTRQGGSAGLMWGNTVGSIDQKPYGFVYMSAALTAASHTFRLQASVDAGTMTLKAGAAVPLNFWVVELGG